MSQKKTRKNSSGEVSRRSHHSSEKEDSSTSQALPDRSRSESTNGHDEVSNTQHNLVPTSSHTDWKFFAHVGAELFVVGGLGVYMFKTTNSLKNRVDKIEQQTSQVLATSSHVPGYLKVLNGKIQDLESKYDDQSKRLAEAENYIGELLNMITPNPLVNHPPLSSLPKNSHRPQRRSRNEKNTSQLHQEHRGSEDENCEGGVCPLPKSQFKKKVRIRESTGSQSFSRRSNGPITVSAELDSDDEDLDAELEAELGDLHGTVNGLSNRKTHKRQS